MLYKTPGLKMKPCKWCNMERLNEKKLNKNINKWNCHESRHACMSSCPPVRRGPHSPQPSGSFLHDISCDLDKTFIPSHSHLLFRSCPVVCSGVYKPATALTTRDACLLRGNTLDLKPFLCPQAGVFVVYRPRATQLKLHSPAASRYRL